MGDKLVKYKPQAGDLLVFPSGHPDYLTEEGKPYLHGVMPSYNKNKFLARMYWQKYQRGTANGMKKKKSLEKKYGQKCSQSYMKSLGKNTHKDQL
jgi:hypothetical protein